MAKRKPPKPQKRTNDEWFAPVTPNDSNPEVLDLRKEVSGLQLDLMETLDMLRMMLDDPSDRWKKVCSEWLEDRKGWYV